MGTRLNLPGKVPGRRATADPGDAVSTNGSIHLGNSHWRGNNSGRHSIDGGKGSLVANEFFHHSIHYEGDAIGGTVLNAFDFLVKETRSTRRIGVGFDKTLQILQ